MKILQKIIILSLLAPGVFAASAAPSGAPAHFTRGVLKRASAMVDPYHVFVPEAGAASVAQASEPPAGSATAAGDVRTFPEADASAGVSSSVSAGASTLPSVLSLPPCVHLGSASGGSKSLKKPG